MPGQNGRQFTTAWVDTLDAGQAPTGAPVPPSLRQDFPFKLDGSVEGAGAVPTSRKVDFNGDNKADLAVARATGAAAQTTWYINDGINSTTTDWGLGVGFTGGDVATPEDFDGDGKTDIAVWRSDPTAANFYILQSQSNTLRTEQFGKAGDDARVVDDYDGDGKADVAVFRETPGGGDPSAQPASGTGDRPALRLLTLAMPAGDHPAIKPIRAISTVTAEQTRASSETTAAPASCCKIAPPPESAQSALATSRTGI